MVVFLGFLFWLGRLFGGKVYVMVGWFLVGGM